MAGRYVECKTQDDLKRVLDDGDIPVLREGYWQIGGSARVEAYDSARVEAYDSARVRAYDSARVLAYGSARVLAYDSARVRAYDSAMVEAYGSAMVEAYDSAMVEAYDSAMVEAYGSARVRALARAIVRVLSASVTIEASGWATVILHAAANVVAEASVVIAERIVRTIHDWANAYGAQQRDGKLVMFKWAGADGTTRNGVRYIEGQMVEAPDWDPDPDRECGGGLHACATLAGASGFHSRVHCAEPRRAVELLVDPDDCRAPQPDDDYPHKVRFRRAFVVRVWDADKDGEAS